MSTTQQDAVEVLSAHMSEAVSTPQQQAEFCSRYYIKPYKDGWLFQPKHDGKGPTPLWWMVVDSTCYGFHFFKESTMRAYASVCQLKSSSVRAG